jgi:hypothetical protein
MFGDWQRMISINCMTSARGCVMTSGPQHIPGGPMGFLMEMFHVFDLELPLDMSANAKYIPHLEWAETNPVVCYFFEKES